MNTVNKQTLINEGVPAVGELKGSVVSKYCDTKKLKLESLVMQKGNELVIELLRFLIRSARTTAFTGAAGSGKTTLLMSVIGDIHPALNVRTSEKALEMNLRAIYPERNILSFLETDNIMEKMALDIKRKTNGNVNVFGDVTSDAVASQMIQDAQIGSLFTLFTHHAKTPENLINSIRNSLLIKAAFKDMVEAERQVAEVIEFNVHLMLDCDGKRYIERITQIIPIKQEAIDKIKSLQDIMFVTRNIIEYRDGQYVAVNPISNDKMVAMKLQMSNEDAMRFEELIKEQQW